MPEIQTTDLPGYRKKSFLLCYNGGEIWFEHLEGMCEHEDLVLGKLHADVPLFTKPSSTAFVCFVFFDTAVTDRILSAVNETVSGLGKHFTAIAFCGVNRKTQRKLKKALSNKGIRIAFFDGLEDAKVWLLP